MELLLIFLAITIVLIAIIMRNANHNCDETRGIVLGIAISTAIWLLIIIIVKGWCILWKYLS